MEVLPFACDLVESGIICSQDEYGNPGITSKVHPLDLLSGYLCARNRKLPLHTSCTGHEIDH